MEAIYNYYKNNYNVLTKTEKKIAEFIIKNPKKVIVLSALDLGKEIGVSDASVLRFSKTIGFEKFSDLKNFLAEELSNHKNPNERITSNWNNFDSKDDLVNKIINGDLENIKRFLSEIDINQLNDAVEMLNNSKKIYYLGLGSSKVIAQYMYWYTRRMGFECECINEGGLELYEVIQNMKKNETVFMFSFPRILSDEVRAINFAKEKKLKIITVTTNVFSEVGILSDIVFKLTVDNHGFFNSYAVPIELCHLILTMLFEKNKEKIYAKIKENEHIKNFLFEIDK